MAVLSDSIVMISLVDGNNLTSNEKIGMNLDEVDIKGCLEAEGRVNVYHEHGGYTIVSERDVVSIKTIRETINWSKAMEWIDSSTHEPSDFFMQSVSGDLSFSQIEEHYEFGFYLRDKKTKATLSLESIRSHFKFIH